MMSWVARLKPSKQVISMLWPLMAIALFSAAGWLLHKTLKKHSWQDFLDAIAAIPHTHVWWAIGLTVISYVVLAGYDASALFYVRKKVPWPRIFMASFMGFAFSQNLGVSPITGGSVRLRLYGHSGIGPIDVAKIVAFCILTYSIGVTAIFGFVMAFFPYYLEPFEFMPTLLSEILGGLTLAIVTGYIFWVGHRKHPIQFKGFEFKMPSAPLSIFQLIITVTDVAVASAILYVLLPDSKIIGYQHFFFIYVIGTTIGILSHVPGGLGVFEWVVLTMLGNYYSAPTIFGTLLLFRIIYLLGPLAIAAVFLVLFEWQEGRRKKPTP
ncbi:MAG: UPF0104 family protein [Alphaproteobacteria bacterium]|nr:MAG: UPF0104 family protein [Alphaproteobacteria bacterium]